jgi:hypothetical protein
MQVDPIPERSDAWIDFADFAHDVAQAMTANVTALKFFSLRDAKATEVVVLKDIIGALPGNDRSAKGFVWVSKPDVADIGNTICLTEASGYDSVADHWKWRDTPECTEMTKVIEAVARDTGLKAVDVLGKRRSMFEGSGIVHVSLKKIA